MKELFKSLWADESGQGLTEYALIVALVSIALIRFLSYWLVEYAVIFAEAINIVAGLRRDGVSLGLPDRHHFFLDGARARSFVYLQLRRHPPGRCARRVREQDQRRQRSYRRPTSHRRRGFGLA